jgi:hypothetical protein
VAKHKHTGKIKHDDMSSLIRGVGGKDKLAHESHHKANKEHGMPEGMGVSESHGGSYKQEAGRGMASNESCEDCD